MDAAGPAGLPEPGSIPQPYINPLLQVLIGPQRLDLGSKTIIRSFGPIQLCGALHVCWQSKSGVNGQYMVTLLYKQCLVLATAGKADQIYTIQACISLDSVRIEEADNGRGKFFTYMY